MNTTAKNHGLSITVDYSRWHSTQDSPGGCEVEDYRVEVEDLWEAIDAFVRTDSGCDALQNWFSIPEIAESFRLLCEGCFGDEMAQQAMEEDW